MFDNSSAVFMFVVASLC